MENTDKNENRPPRAEDIARGLRDRIIRGELVAGQRLVERDIAEWYAISRTPIREAIKILAAEGLVVLRPNRGAEIASFDRETASNLFKVIAELEALAAREFAERMTSSQFNELESRHDLMLRHFQRRELESYFFVNSSIHDLIIRECGNPILCEAHERLMMRARLGRHMALLDEARWREAVDEHEQLMTALRRHDSAAAAGIWRRHLLNSGRALAHFVEPR
ncbi:GntR family transcriptional regulator [Paracoccus ravus]|uniref:GntR family transcriptional regulator n=1 Tax=Paracoccus ravus TaxID=2447760 RepID=UPI001431FC8D|nr:GntR family transcriptional regulator [Paracoccus ravus]